MKMKTFGTREAIYVRVSTNDQTTENQLPDLEADDDDAKASDQEEEPATVLDGGRSSLAAPCRAT